jgi:D-glycero-D-manno-heptose 1,7-bisphosphate phosphatase
MSIPDDYTRSDIDIPKRLFPILDKSWTIFLDRDGVLNSHLQDTSVRNRNELFWIDGSLDTVVLLSKLVGKIVVVTNQQGIGKGQMTHLDLEDIHYAMQDDVLKSGGRIDQFFYCPHRKEINCKCRKPKIGLALRAQQDYPDIDFSKSIMVGDSLTDMQFGKALGMFCVSIRTSNIPFQIEDIMLEKLENLNHYLKKSE